jgi:hypothetical protein
LPKRVLKSRQTYGQKQSALLEIIETNKENSMKKIRCQYSIHKNAYLILDERKIFLGIVWKESFYDDGCKWSWKSSNENAFGRTPTLKEAFPLMRENQ